MFKPNNAFIAATKVFLYLTPLVVILQVYRIKSVTNFITNLYRVHLPSTGNRARTFNDDSHCMHM